MEGANDAHEREDAHTSDLDIGVWGNTEDEIENKETENEALVSSSILGPAFPESLTTSGDVSITQNQDPGNVSDTDLHITKKALDTPVQSTTITCVQDAWEAFRSPLSFPTAPQPAWRPRTNPYSVIAVADTVIRSLERRRQQTTGQISTSSSLSHVPSNTPDEKWIESCITSIENQRRHAERVRKDFEKKKANIRKKQQVKSQRKPKKYIPYIGKEDSDYADSDDENEDDKENEDVKVICYDKEQRPKIGDTEISRAKKSKNQQKTHEVIYSRTEAVGSDDSSTISDSESTNQQKSHEVIYSRTGAVRSDDSSAISDSDAETSLSGSDYEISFREHSTCLVDSDNDKPENWYEKSLKLFYGNEDTGSQTDILEGKILTEGVSLTDKYMDKFRNRDDRNVRDEFYTSDKVDDWNGKCTGNPEKYVRCTIDIHSAHRAIATPVDARPDLKTIEIQGRAKCGKAFTEDEVVVEILKKNVSLNMNRVKDEENKTTYGKVVKILERRRHSLIEHPVFICVLDNHEGHLMIPLCKTLPKISVLAHNVKNKFPKERKHKVDVYKYIEDKGVLQFQKTQDIKPEERNHYRFLVCYLKWGNKYVYPRGAIIGAIKLNVSDISTELKFIRIQNHVPTLYPESAVREVQRVLGESRILDNVPREDFTERLTVITIDPPYSKDLDDALSVEILPEKDTFRVGVHIADVTSVVEQNTEIDREARRRCTTYYPSQESKPFHMLPEPLSQECLSLLPNEKRPVISVFFTFQKNIIQQGEPDIRRTIIQSKRRFTYQEAQDIIDGDSDPQEHINWCIKLLYQISNYQRRIRLKGSIHSFPVEFDLASETADTIRNADAHSLVEEFMILANHTVGKFLTNTYKDVVPLRCQSSPTEEKLQSWLNNYQYLADILMKLQGTELPSAPERSSSRILNAERAPPARWNRLLPIQSWVWESIVAAVEENDPKRVQQLVGSDDLHPQQSFALQEWIAFQETASYQCSGSIENIHKDGRHFSLGFDSYVHFTSPIRRYVDMVIHRLLHFALDGKDVPPYDREDIEAICSDMNRALQDAKSFQKQCNLLSLSMKLKKQPAKIVGFVEEISDEGVVVHMPGLKRIPKERRLLRFSLLDVSSKPRQEEDLDLLPYNMNQKRMLSTVVWQKRVYLHKGFEMKVPKKMLSKDEQTENCSINPHQRTVFLKYSQWIEILMALFSTEEELFRSIKDTASDMKFGASHMYVKSCFRAKNDVSSENRNGIITNQLCRFKLPFHLNQTVAVQVTADYDRGVLLPYIQFFDMTRNISYCLQHFDDPVRFLAKYATAPPKPEYRKSPEYVRTWLPIVEMESATNAVRSEESAVINGIPMEFNKYCGVFYLNNRFCKERDIDFGYTALDIFDDGDEEDKRKEKEQTKNKPEFKDLESSNYICIRCPIIENMQKEAKYSAQGRILGEKLMWIGHGELTKLRKVKRIHNGMCYEVHFRLNKESTPAPMREAKTTDECSLEILMKSKVDRRIETVLKMLPQATKLAQSVALGKRILELEALHQEIVAVIPTDVTVEGVTLPMNNSQQKKAIEKALTSRFSLIQGPPGTGKTYTGIKLLYLFSLFNLRYCEKTSEKRLVLFCGPSNKSVDLVAKQALNRLGHHVPKMIRMYGQAYECLDFPIPGRVNASQRSLRDSKPDRFLVEKNIVLHYEIRKDGKPYADKLKEFDKRFMEKSNPPTIDETDKYLEILSKATKEELKNYDVILCTTSMAANPKLLRATKGKIYQCIIDEAGMCTEPETMVPIIATRAAQVVLIGDHKQLQPIILCKEAAEIGLETSLFERYAKIQKKMEKLNVKYTMLVWQYRMNPNICKFPSKTFYDGKLKTANSSYWKVERPLKIWNNPDPDTHIPLAFCHIEGTEERLTVSTEEGNEKSRKNMEEAKHVVKIYKHLVDIEKVRTNNIQIISQYNAQRHAIQEALTQEGLINIKVSTVVSSQGAEWDYVIFSTVVSLPGYLIENNPTHGWCRQNLGFITDHHQVNVALTRARKGLIIIGNKHLLKCDEVWKDLVENYESNGRMFTSSEFPVQKPPTWQQNRMQKAPRYQRKSKQNR